MREASRRDDTAFITPAHQRTHALRLSAAATLSLEATRRYLHKLETGYVAASDTMTPAPHRHKARVCGVKQAAITRAAFYTFI